MGPFTSLPAEESSDPAGRDRFRQLIMGPHDKWSHSSGRRAL